MMGRQPFEIEKLLGMAIQIADALSRHTPKGSCTGTSSPPIFLSRRAGK
jgi:hypothetical protein